MSSLDTLQGCKAFVKSQSADLIAEQLRKDQAACREDTAAPSLLVYCLPTHSDAIAHAISPDTPISISRLRLSGIVSLVKSHLGQSAWKKEYPDHVIPTNTEFESALKVMRYLHLQKTIPSTTFDQISETIHHQLFRGSLLRQKEIVESQKRRNCYICHFRLLKPHPSYPSLCSNCGEFNLSCSSLSSHPNLDLQGRTALVTGGRINLGFHTALRLLRSGASVIVSSRYPLDAHHRYLQEKDAQEWEPRLKVVGADFRNSKDVFELVNVVIQCLTHWGGTKNPKLDILINNAVQTWTDTIEMEQNLIENEVRLSQNTSHPLLLESNYVPRIRGGVVEQPHALISSSTEGTLSKDVLQQEKCSWMQRISEIPYQDIISSHSVNTFVPFILLREFLPYLQLPNTTTTDTSKANGYVINVSAREGIFESFPTSSQKAGYHTHTNMAKAALNMLTESEASAAWKNGRVAINTVDPGFLSAHPMFLESLGARRRGEPCPIGWEDGAGRVLWPIAKGEAGGDVPFGRFFKHFSEIFQSLRGATMN